RLDLATQPGSDRLGIEQRSGPRVVRLAGAFDVLPLPPVPLLPPSVMVFVSVFVSVLVSVLVSVVVSVLASVLVSLAVSDFVSAGLLDEYKSLYQPLPLSWNAVREMIRSSAPPQASQIVLSGSLIRCWD